VWKRGEDKSPGLGLDASNRKKRKKEGKGRLEDRSIFVLERRARLGVSIRYFHVPARLNIDRLMIVHRIWRKLREERNGKNKSLDGDEGCLACFDEAN
jgi:hypothetical protein